MEKIILDNRYEIIEQIGLGGMAKVYKAKDRLLDRFVAIKVLKDQYAEDEEFLKKFNNEAQSAAKLNHVNIVNVYDIGEDLLEGRKIYYIVMEYVEGQTLKDLIDEEGKLSNHDIIDYSVQIAQALKSAHASGIIHRDIKPQNILIDKFGLAKVTDFGIARVSSNATITYTSSILGTVHYISPEQAKGKIVDEKSDLYSLGAVMYEMATGKVPFDADNSVGIAVMHIQDKARPAKELNPDLSDHLNFIIMKLLEKEPGNRFLNATELIDSLENQNFSNKQVLEETARIPIVVPNKEKKKKKKAKKEVTPKSEEAVYVSPTDEEPEEKEKNKSLKIWPLALLALILVGAVYHFMSRPKVDVLEVPTVINLSQEMAVKELEKRGLKANISRTEESDDYDKGKVMKQDPEANTEVKKGTTVNLVISAGREVSVPDLAGLNLTEAEEKLKELGLSIGRTSTEYSDQVEKDLIIDQNPRSSTNLQAGSKVDLIISAGPEEKIENIEVPSLIGMSEEQAASLISQYGLVLRNVDYTESEDVEKGNVISQSISEGTLVAPQSQIDLVISNGKKEKEKDKEDRTNQAKNVDLRLNINNGKDKFNVKIYKLDDNDKRSDILYDQNQTSKDLDESQVLQLNFQAVQNTKFEVLVDDESYGVYTVN
ncbi:MAG: Stk1 family PASTA domain-containing Ser/Thr kinase [Anaerococcus sp.]|uniref:Stk1 family PASTA domain-containing Ser/Thr kinase n=1 Tax=Anaerococcus sp. TaxID=1872515 RepID=UPI002620E9C9|nr:Stk1 family PASTA domain-containing Ser/Thr kinase [Anaerococcus sp.]MCI5971531.1 Stk1 family PASTA domain-containing Ser/Thr kinase [Anaerococcus sp.]MDD6919263.1 Stk1 family PASTA domain-containing Ser/Thr kinase [Peptoniphilaceae bacterium]MDY2927914.1 Stk1 family PASTA domain-containing Ser/Thr kinase [Anaerococcus sp.]